MHDLDDARRAEAEAREELWNYARTDELVRGFDASLDEFAEAVRHTVEVRAEALVTQLVWKLAGRIGVPWEDALANRPNHYQVRQTLNEAREFSAALTAFREGVK